MFRDVESVPADVTLAPPWLSRIPCTRVVGTLLDCGPLEFGTARECGRTQRLFCTDGPGACTSIMMVQYHVQIDFRTLRINGRINCRYAEHGERPQQKLCSAADYAGCMPYRKHNRLD